MRGPVHCNAPVSTWILLGCACRKLNPATRSYPINIMNTAERSSTPRPRPSGDLFGHKEGNARQGAGDRMWSQRDNGAVEDEAHHRLFGERTSIQGIHPRARGGLIADGGRPCRGGNRQTHRQILAAAK